MTVTAQKEAAYRAATAGSGSPLTSVPEQGRKPGPHFVHHVRRAAPDRIGVAGFPVDTFQVIGLTPLAPLPAGTVHFEWVPWA